ncbi:MAG: tetratricopeptide repeat protein [Deltaproteobacteria bacterium]|nr:tetratricopeptide repeat protein [Deltaproteobacteria bacterium]
MTKLRLLLLIMACMAIPWDSADAADPGPCPKGIPPMSEALHDVVDHAEIRAGDGDAAGAAAVLTGWIEAHPGETHPYPYYDAGYFLHQDGKRDAALDCLQKAVRLNPCFHEAWQLLAALYQEAGEMAEAAGALEKAAAVTQDPETWHQTAVLWLDAGLPQKALAVLKKLHRAGPRQVDGYVAEAHAHQDLKDPVKAAEAMASAYAISKDPEHLYQCAVFWLEAGKPARALPLLKALTDGDAPESHWLVALSNTLKALKKKEETAEAMGRAAERGRDPNLWFHAAWLWLDADHPKKALVILKELAQRKDPRVEWLVALANAYMILDQTRSAAETMDRVIRKDPKPEYLYNGGVLWLHAEQPQKALGHLLVLCKRSPPKAEWFVALAHAWLWQKELVKAATAMERGAALSRNPEHAYQAGLMWLQAKQADPAIRLLVPLGRESSPKAIWLAALSNAWAMKEDFEKAAQAMEQAAGISQAPDHFYSAAGLWLQAERPPKALPLLEALARRPGPEAKWLTLLSETWLRLKDVPRAAQAMETGAEITGEGEDYYRAGMLWQQAGDIRKGIALLEISVTKAPVEQKWRVALAQALVDADQEKEALVVMNRTTLTDPKAPAAVRCQGALVWLRLQRPGHALPVLKVLCASGTPTHDWLSALVKTHVELDQMPEAEMSLKLLIDLYPEGLAAWRLAMWVALQQSDYPRAAAAMAVAVRLGPPDPGQMKELADLYHMAGVPVKAAAVLQKTWTGDPTAEDWDRLTSIYLSGHRYDMALACARSSAQAQATADRWEMVGAIAFRLRRFEESYDAYCRSAEFSPEADIRLKAGYAALKLDRLDEAGRLFKEAIRRAGNGSRTGDEAHRNLAFIKRVMTTHEKGG